MENKTKVSKGDSWIKVANRYGINLDDLLYWNGIDPTSREALPELFPGQEIYTKDPYTLPAAVSTASAPKDYVDFGEDGQKKIDAYRQAFASGKIQWNQIPKIFQTAVMQKGITNTTNKAARTIANVALNGAEFMINPVAYTSGLVAQKGTAYGADKVSGRNEYNTSDILNDTPIMGRKYAAENPGKSTLIDFGAGVLGGWGLPTITMNIGNLARTSSQWAPGVFQRAAVGTGMPRQTVQIAEAPGSIGGTVFRSGVNGFGRIGAPKGNPSVGYRTASGAKGVFSNSYSAIPKGKPFTPAQTILTPIVFPTPATFGVPASPIFFGDSNSKPNFIIQSNPQHWYHQQGFNRWQMPNPTGEIGQYQPGTGSFIVYGHAPIAGSPEDQRFTKETLRVDNSYGPSFATKVPGIIEGTPSNVYTTAGFENPPQIKKNKQGGILKRVKKVQDGGFIDSVWAELIPGVSTYKSIRDFDSEHPVKSSLKVVGNATLDGISLFGIGKLAQAAKVGRSAYKGAKAGEAALKLANNAAEATRMELSWMRDAEKVAANAERSAVDAVNSVAKQYGKDAALNYARTSGKPLIDKAINTREAFQDATRAYSNAVTKSDHLYNTAHSLLGTAEWDKNLAKTAANMGVASISGSEGLKSINHLKSGGILKRIPSAKSGIKIKPEIKESLQRLRKEQESLLKN